MRAARTSKLVSSMAILGLIVVSIFIVLVLNSSVLVNPTLPIQGGNRGGPSPTGTLTIRLSSNQNQTNRFANSGGFPRLFPIRDKPMQVTEAINATNPFTQVMVTDSRGSVSQVLAPGPYVVNLKDESVDVNIPVEVYADNETTLSVTVDGTAYPLAYSEESGLHPAGGSAQSSMFAELTTSVPAAAAGDSVVLEVHGAPPGSGYLVNASVISSQPPTRGAQWLELGTAGAIDPVNATSIVLTTWTSSAFITVRPTGQFVFANA